MSKLDILFSHKTDDWSTPTWLYDTFIKLGFIDPCPLHCEVDNLNNIYFNKFIYVNPPYSAIDQWVSFINNNYKNNHIALLIPSRTDTRYFHLLMRLHPRIIFIKGRLRFGDSNCAPFPSLLMLFNKYEFNDYLCLTQDMLSKYLEVLYAKSNNTNG